ncbi:SDR family NAD(P)-dependent oxidoreductase [Aeromicrobium senzhongii]|uniref:SDR family NAD(P)-dependent oxidoreductase n=1 Tax=Aeromicrobium senzhongii TaxID=2663859 RepID=A0ABX6SXE1_9ACTN|nr:SDR family NAD(P)-dependent oxidoreductase [Aeromicrobium senzhongii]MTB87163.1 SDR family NAD(P)-dependent oxidoreductase [Aeromicrobium senzhongii]QNL95758.1 SDR family NAD(P)-dependent oxidoreductase [Aeromicrobium senzhongii]
MLLQSSRARQGVGAHAGRALLLLSRVLPAGRTRATLSGHQCPLNSVTREVEIMVEELRYDGRVAIVTGAGIGIGAAHARLLASRGARVVVNELPRNIERAELVCEQIRSAGGEAIAVAGEIGIDDDARALVDATIAKYGRVDIVIHNAGVPLGRDMDGSGLVQEAPSPRFDRYMDVNVRGSLQLNRAVWPHFVAQKYGRVLFTSSAVGTGFWYSPTGYELDYATSKLAVFALARQVSAAGQEHGIIANTVMPWAFTETVGDSADGEETELITFMRATLQPEKVAIAVAPLLHENAPTTGEAFTAGGGRIARVFLAGVRGYLNPELTPEDVVENWTQVFGETGASGEMLDVFEQSQPREERMFMKTLETQTMPDLAWIAEQSVKDSTRSAAL